MSAAISTSGQRRKRTKRPSVREVCLIGIPHPSPTQVWEAGERLICSGRTYRIEAAQRPASGGVPVYLHLAEAVEAVG